MPDKSSPASFPSSPANDIRSTAGGAAAPSPRSTLQRGPEVRDAMAEMAERAQAISQEAGTKIASAMRDVIDTAAGIAGFAVESVRDLVQYMVRRGQMTQDEADRLIREAEEARGKRAAKGEAKAAAPKAESKTAAAAGSTKEPAPRAAPKAAKKAAAKPAAASEKKPTAKKATTAKKRR